MSQARLHMDDRSFDRRMRLLAFLASAILVAIGYRAAIDVGFLSDDFQLISEIRARGLAFGWNLWGIESGGFFRPLTIASLALDHAVFGLDARGYHLVSLTIHVVDALLAGEVAASFVGAELSRREARMLGVATTVAFATLASHSEPVVWICCRSDLLATGLALAATWATTYAETSRRAAIAACFLVFLACCAKESAVVIPIVWGIVALVRSGGRPGRIPRATRRLLGGGLLTLIVFLTVRSAAIGHLVGGYGPSLVLPPTVFEGVRTLFRMIGRPLLPPIPFRWHGSLRILGATAAVAIPFVVAALRLRRTTPALRRSFGIALAAAAIACLPPIGIGVARIGSDGERLVYLASAFVVPAALLAFRIGFGDRAGAALAAAAFGFHALVVPQVLEPWTSAGEATRALVAFGVAHTDEPVCLVATPDSIEGALVLRWGYPEALELAGRPIDAPPVHRAYSIRFGAADRFSSSVHGDELRLELSRRARVSPFFPVEPAACAARLEDRTLVLGPRVDARRFLLQPPLVGRPGSARIVPLDP